MSVSGVFAAVSVPPTPALTLKAFQQRSFSLTLPVVPSSMVPNPPDSQDPTLAASLPTPLLRALYYHGATGRSPAGLGPHPTRSTILANLGEDLGPARVYTVPHHQAIWWAYGSAILQAQHARLPVQPGIPSGWRTFIREMSRHSRIARTVRGTLGAPPSLPKTVPDASAWTVVTCHHVPIPNFKRVRLPYFRGVFIVIHQNMVWILLSGLPKDIVAPNSRVPAQLIPAPRGARDIPASQISSALFRHFPRRLTQTFPIRVNAHIRLYDGVSTGMLAWLWNQYHHLNTYRFGYNGGDRYGVWNGVHWAYVEFALGATPTPHAGIWIFVTPSGWVDIAANDS